MSDFDNSPGTLLLNFGHPDENSHQCQETSLINHLAGAICLSQKSTFGKHNKSNWQYINLAINKQQNLNKKIK